MFEQVFRNVDDILRRDSGCGSELDYIEQTSWVLFLKYLHDLERDAEKASALSGRPYRKIIKKDFRWDIWAAPKTKKGIIDHNRALRGDDLKDFVNDKLFPYLKKFRASADASNTIEYKIGEIFSELRNKLQSGHNLREIINLIDELHFRSSKEKYEMSFLYESKIEKMGHAGRNGGEYYTPRPLIKTIVKIIGPQIGEKIYDGAAGSAGFLCEAFDYMSGHLRKSKKFNRKNKETLQKKTFYGKEKKSLAYIIGTMNMIFHGVEAPNIVHTNTLTENLTDIQESDRHHIVLANPPFGGKERKEIQQNFPIKTGETAFLFLQHFIKMLKVGGRAGVVIKNTFLSNTDKASMSLRKELLESCNLHTILDLPRGVFTGAGVKTIVLFFEKGRPTKKIWYYELDPGRNLGKTNPLNESDLEEFVKLQKKFTSSLKSWSIQVKDIDKNSFDLSVKNPHAPEQGPSRHPQEIMAQIKLLDREAKEVIASLEELI